MITKEAITNKPKVQGDGHVDGASNSQGSGAGLIFTRQDGVVTEYTLWFDFNTSNNEAKYEALITGLKIAKELKAFIDLQLIIEHVQGE